VAGHPGHPLDPALGGLRSGRRGEGSRLKARWWVWMMSRGGDDDGDGLPLLG